jgi:cyclase
MKSARELVPIIGHTNGLTLLATRFIEQMPFEFWPNDAFFGARKDLFFNGEGIEMMHQPNAITEGDIMVYFRKSDVLVTGSIFDISLYPHFYPDLGGSLQGVIDALNNIVDITIAEFNQQSGTLVIPGRGRLASESDVVEYRDMVTIIRDRVQLMISEGKTFQEVLAARPSLEYDSIYGSNSGEWTTQMFLEAVYNEFQ